MKKNIKLVNYRNVILIVMDVLCIVFANLIGMLLIMTESIYNFEEYYFRRFINTILVSIPIYLSVFILTKRYKNIIRYEDSNDYAIYFALSMVSGLIITIVRKSFNIFMAETKATFIASIFIAVAMIVYRVVVKYFLLHDVKCNVDIKEKKKLLIIGAGSAAHEIINTIHTKLNNFYEIVGIIDDNKKRLNYSVSGVKIIGNRNDIIKIATEKNVDEIFISIANIDNKNKQEILNICEKTNARVRILPGLNEIIRNKQLFENLRDVEVEDLLGREPIKLDNDNISDLIKNNSVLVTGAGGSIGSELCRQIIKYKPKRLVMLDIYENNLYDIELELKSKFPKKEINAIIGSVRDKNRLNDIFEKYEPKLVFHAAAHKHVPLMENSPLEAIKNNVFGTYNVVNASDKYNVNKFILVSTDKAVNPTNIMGATKRLCEMIVQAKNKISKTEFVAVRFGNVLGSNGSVIPLFKKQIAQGGPVTVTDKEITRFFMLIPEAVALILQAITYAKGGEIFVLDMGKPVKIYDLAESLIKLSGFVPHKDIEIEITGLRPGEKLYEELLMGEEGLQKTDHNKIFVAEPLDITMDDINSKLDKLNNLIEKEDSSLKDVKGVIKEIVPTYVEADVKNKKEIKTK